MAARHAQAKVDPRAADLQAVLTTIGTWCDVADLRKMLAAFHLTFLPFLPIVFWLDGIRQ